MEQVLVADIINKEVVYSTTNLEAACQLQYGTQQFFEISKLEPPMAPMDIHDTIKKVDATIDVVKGCLKFGMLLAPPPFNVTCAAIAGLGSLIQSGLKFVPGKEDPVKKKIMELVEQIDKLDEKTKARFDDLKSFITENNFSVEIINEIATQKKFMIDCITFCTPHSIQNFKEAYEQNTPITMIYTLMSLLEQKSTNPLFMAMAAEKLKTTVVFHKWEDTIKAVTGEIKLLEAFACGLLKNNEQYHCEIILERSEEIYDAMKIWRKEYEIVDWDQMTEHIKDYLKFNWRLSNSEKADEIKKKIEAIADKDAFYIIVCDHRKSFDENRLWYKDVIDNKQLIVIKDCGGANCFIYCSKKANTVVMKSLEAMKKDVQSYINRKFSGKLTEKLVAKPIPNAGFILLIGDLKEEIRVANFKRYEDGPGWYTYYYDFGGPVARRLLVGYI